MPARFALSSLIAASPQYPTVPPQLASQVGWLFFAALICLLLWVWFRSESVRRSLLALEDPRTYAVLRIGFALMTLQCFWNLHPYWRMLWSDEGLFLLDEARKRLGSSALVGWTPEEGFLNGWAVLHFFKGNYSAFLLRGSPEFVAFYMYSFFAVLLLFAAGVASRFTGILAFVMMSSIYHRNSLYLEGTDTVYRVFWFLLLFCKTGHAWSFDNWWRCRRLRKKDKLQQDSIYRLVPAWPRYLMMFQLICIYTATGVVKTGSVWARGDAFYYALNMDHFYRFEIWTQQVSSIFSTNLFRLMTWVTHYWEMGFSLLGLGMVLKFGLEHQDQAWYRSVYRSAWRRWGSYICMIAVYALVYRIVILAYPYCLAINKNATPEQTDAHVSQGLSKIHIVFAVVVPLLVALWFICKRWPLRIGPVQIKRWRFPSVCINAAWLRKWFLGRRIWLSLGLMFHGTLILFMNIGMFPFIMLMTYVAWFKGEEIAKAFAWIFAKIHRRQRLRRVLPNLDELFHPAQNPSSVPLRGRRIPDLVVLLLGICGMLLVVLKIYKSDNIKIYTSLWILSILITAMICRFQAKKNAHDQQAISEEARPALAYGTVGRTFALAFTLWHGSAIIMTLFPDYPMFAKWRGQARGLFTTWTSVTKTSQRWNMFAPNPPRSNNFMKTIVVEADGTRWDLQNNAFSYRPFPWIWNDRMRKMQRRMVDKGKWYLKYWANFHCREWMLHSEAMPERIEIYKLTTQIPSPEQVHSKGWYNPSKLKVKETLVEKHDCPADMPVFMKRRYGLKISEEDLEQEANEAQTVHEYYQSRKETWLKRKHFDFLSTKPSTLPHAKRTDE